jgi:hypothetical protein
MNFSNDEIFCKKIVLNKNILINHQLLTVIN